MSEATLTDHACDMLALLNRQAVPRSNLHPETVSILLRHGKVSEVTRPSPFHHNRGEPISWVVGRREADLFDGAGRAN